MTGHSASASPGQGLDIGWWAKGLALSERLVGTGRLVQPRTDHPAHRQVARWRAGYGPAGADRFAERLAGTGLTEDLLAALLAEPAERLAARTARPEWADTVDSAVRAAQPPAAGLPVPADWREAFAIPLRPLVDAAQDQLARQGEGLAHVDVPAVLDTFAAGLRKRLVSLAVRTFVAELNAQRAAGQLVGADGKERFAFFVRRLAEPTNLVALFTAYPVLARLLGQAAGQDVAAHAELLTRFAADRAAIVTTLFDGVDPGRMVSIEAARGDRHGSGRSVAIVVFESGRRVVYRPRDVGTHVWLAEMVDWLNRRVPDLGLRTVTTLARPGYGWLEFVQAAPVQDLAAADRFYRRQGALLALLHILHAGDMHHENLVAAGDTPVLVDVETLFHPDFELTEAPPDAASAMLGHSVQRTALLPMMIVGSHGTADVSGLGGDRGASPYGVLDWEFAGTDRMRITRRPGEFGGGHNRPRLGGRDLDPGEHEAAFLDGFRVGYDAILRHPAEFTGLIQAAADLDVRLIARPTSGYAVLLDETTHPDLLRDAADRDRALDVLWTDSAACPLRWRLSPHELADMWTGNVPLFTTRPDSRDVRTSTGESLPGLLTASGLGQALAKLAAMSEVDLHHQEWIISATLATRLPADGHRGVERVAEPMTGAAANPERLLAASCAIADLIVAKGLTDGGRVNWLGLEYVDNRQWLVLPMGAGLANGYLGVALFLAHLADLSGIHRYGELARRAVDAVPQVLEMAAGRPDLLRLIGSGALNGFGGIAYALARLATLLDDTEIRKWALVAAEHAAIADPHGPADWANGSAGCLAALTAVAAELGESRVAGLARSCADRLVDMDLPDDAGFAFGAAGTAWALAGAAEPDAARAAVERATPFEPAGHGWCSGLAGLAVARAAVDPEPDHIVRAARLLADRPVLRDLSLCHGELGIAEALTVLSAQMPSASVIAAAARRRAGLVLDAIDRYGPTCGTPGAVSSPGLLNGLAGIGYGLLRLGFSDRVPSVLLVRPGYPAENHKPRET
ncbi:type 2 lanthipeptide synthetase LanM family protein [Actinocrispum wychmicini]|uniref:type 2 lanthipeptide synthetase LanM family protein n=1 Tax=Actinocrispum wychmicini TaxID=1213861 RepID=UPI00140454CB|nr:type 2 lanthipeptide synthetase LanM family protein [Actinocrispum wychmicini]